MDPTKFPPWLRLAVPITALLLIVYEAVGYHGQGGPRYWLLVVYTAMLGIPSLLVSDARGKPPTPPPPPNPPPVVEPQPRVETDPQPRPGVDP